MIFHLLYISERTTLYQESDIHSIIHNSQLRNAAREITGILIKNNKFFIQLIEGPEESVMNLYKLITKDKRHDKARVLMSFRDGNRIFPSWNMGLVETTETDARMEEFIPYLHAGTMKFSGTKEKMIAVLRKFNS